MRLRALETVLADWRATADAMARAGKTDTEDLIRTICNEVEASAEDYLKFLPETEAVLHSGYSKDWLRHRYPQWERLGHAKRREHGKADRLYRRCILPRRADIAAARADAVRAAREESK